jgi:hypothetical protein
MRVLLSLPQLMWCFILPVTLIFSSWSDLLV